MRIPVLDISLCTASVFAVAATFAVYAGPTPDLQSMETRIAGDPHRVVIDDAMITSKVQSVLDEDPQTAALRIAVDTRNGVVSLAGAVPNADVGAHVVQLVSEVAGVRDVKNSLRIVATS